jgi:ribosomal-protein-alanine N-acetyltransferase
MKINKVTLEDLIEIHNLEQKVFKDDAFAKDLIKKLIRRNTFFLKLEKSGFKRNIIGFVIIVKDRADRVNIVNFLIKPKYQNKGFGSLLLKHTLDKVRELGEIKRIVLNVKINNKMAIKLYEKFNFRIIEKLENYYKSKESAYLMVLDMDDI